MDTFLMPGKESGMMKEETAEQYLAIIKRAVEIVDGAIAQIAEELGARTVEEREALRKGMQLARPLKIYGANGEVVPLRKRSGEVDYKRFKEILLKAPQPPRAQQAAALQLLNSMPSVLRGALAKTVKKLPHAAGGHPFALKDPEQRLAVCKRIEAYRIRKRLDTAAAIEQVASELNRRQRVVSRKTLSRYYDKFIKAQFGPRRLGVASELAKKQSVKNKIAVPK